MEPLPNGRVLLPGRYEFSAEHPGAELRLGLRFDETTVERLNRDVVTASEAYTIVEDGAGRVVIQITAEGEPPKRRELVFDGPDVLVDTAAPDLRYRRVTEPDPDAAGDAAGAAAEGSEEGGTGPEGSGPDGMEGSQDEGSQGEGSEIDPGPDGSGAATESAGAEG